MAQRRQHGRYFVCINNEGYQVSLECRKIYETRPDALAEKLGQLRIVDESGEDYLYPVEFFMDISLPHSVRQALKLAA